MASSHLDRIRFSELATLRIDPLSIMPAYNPEFFGWVHLSYTGLSNPLQQLAQQLLTQLFLDKASSSLRAELFTPLLRSLYQNI